VPLLCDSYPGICLTNEEKAWKNLSQGKKNLRVQYTYYQKYSIHITKSTVHILPKVLYTYYQKYSIHITKSTVYILPKVQYTYYQRYSIHITKSTVYILPKVQYTYYQKVQYTYYVGPHTCTFSGISLPLILISFPKVCVLALVGHFYVSFCPLFSFPFSEDKKKSTFPSQVIFVSFPIAAP